MILNLISSKQNKEKCADRQDKFEMVSCQFNGKFCKEVRSHLNTNYSNAFKYLQYKEFDKSINALEDAFDKTSELQGSACFSCASFFRSSIAESVENIHDDLASMSHGFFRTNKYESSCKRAKVVLDEFKNGVRELKEAI